MQQSSNLGLAAALIALSVTGARGAPSVVTMADLAPAIPASAARFTQLPSAQSGVRLTYPIDLASPHKHLYVSGFACGGVAAGDLDGDARPDLVFAGTAGKNRIFTNRGKWRFEESAADIGGAGTWASAPALVDIDNDGDLDLYFTNYDAPNALYLNDGAGGFEEAAGRFGLALEDASLAAAFCDYDRDGDLDLYLLTNRYYSPDGFPAEEPKTLTAEQKKFFQFVEGAGGERELNIVPRPDRLLRNDSGPDGQVGRFVDVSRGAGISPNPSHGLAATWWDYDLDGWPDLYVCNDFDDPDSLYRNNGDGTFSDVTARVLPHTTWFSMGADSTDINGDGWPDLLAADMSGTTHFKDKTTMGAMGSRLWVTMTDPRQYMRNALYLGTGTGRMMEAAYLAGVADSDWTWAVKFADFDGDGRDDLFLSNGMTRNFNNSDLPFSKQLFTGRSEWEPYENTPPRREQNLAFRNAAELDFRDVSRTWGLDHEGISYAVASADFDGDGDPDLAVVNMDEPVALYRNDLPQGNRVSVRLAGTKSNRYGIGARIEAHVGGGLQQRWLRPLAGFKSGDEPLAHFGLGRAAKIDRLVIHWPSGIRQELRDLAAGKRYTITEDDKAAKAPAQESKPPLFALHGTLAGAIHGEQEFDDFQFQPLLPNKLSFLGPGSAWGDVDGDGDDDFFLGGGCGHMGQLHLNEGGRFKPAKAWTVATADRGAEDMAALFFDADGDGDLDLFVASGGVEAPPGHPIHSDRLYLNSGTGYFRRARGAIPGPPSSSGAACAADIDRDGDIDLFVGGRIVPGQYPTAPPSRLLLNDGKGAFTDATAELAPALRTAGMVTAALWSDADGDGWLDLLLTREWGSIALMRNAGGKLVDITAASGLASLTGWWNGIAGADFDADGDIDYAVTNFGLNTKYHASEQQPALLYYGDLDGSGVNRLVEAEFEGAICYPIRGRSCSTRAMPSLAERFGSYKSFALAELEQIYAPDRLQGALKLEARELRSGVLRNDGKARFRFEPLPRLAQIAPGFGVVAAELDGDGNLDLAIAQNFFSPQPETGRMDGGLSLLLAGEGDGSFRALRPGESGIVVPGDAASLTLSDADGDGAPELSVGVNSAPAGHFVRAAGRTLAVRLPVQPGVRVTLKTGGKPPQSAELAIGSGYLSQSAPVLFFARPAKAAKLQVRWPDGETTAHDVEAGATRITISR